MRNIFKSPLVCLLLMLGAAGLPAQGFGENIYQFLEQDYSARSAALGGNLGLYKADAEVQLDNPAGLISDSLAQLSVTYSGFVLDFSGGYVSYRFPKYSFGTIAAGLVYFDYGEFTETDINGIPTGGTFSAGETAFLVSYANELEHGIGMGINLKLIHSGLADRVSVGYALDFALDWQAPFLNNGRMLVVVKNFGRQLSSYYDVKEDLPLSISAGVSHKPQYLPITLGLMFRNLNHRSDNFWDVVKRFTLSGEFATSEKFSLRIAYNNQLHESLTVWSGGIGGLSLGFGLRWSDFRFDYAAVFMNDLGTTHRLGILWDI